MLLKEEHVNPYNQYAVSKLAEERAAIGLGWLHGIPTVALRYSITQGARQSLYNQYSGICRIFCSKALQGRALTIYEDGEQTRDFVHINDVVDANMLVLERNDSDFGVFNVGSGKPVTVLEYASAVRKVTGADVDCDIPGAFRRGDNRHSVSSIARLQTLGWRPRHGLTEILDDFVQWIVSIGGVPADVPDALSHMQREGVVCRAKAAPVSIQTNSGVAAGSR
jgi:dTDP-L-rhamnose 4-epimerase